MSSIGSTLISNVNGVSNSQWAYSFEASSLIHLHRNKGSHSHRRLEDPRGTKLLSCSIGSRIYSGAIPASSPIASVLV